MKTLFSRVSLLLSLRGWFGTESCLQSLTRAAHQRDYGRLHSVFDSWNAIAMSSQAIGKPVLHTDFFTKPAPGVTRGRNERTRHCESSGVEESVLKQGADCRSDTLRSLRA